MQENSLITPSEAFLSSIQLSILDGVYYIPRIPEEGEVYTCKGIFKGPSGADCVDVENLALMRDGHPMYMPIELWDELQPPVKVDLEKLMPQQQLVTT